MAIFDAMFELSDDQDIGALTATEVAASTNVINWTQSDLEMGAGEPLWLNVRMGTELFGSAGAATLTVAVKRETDGTIDTDSTTVYTTPALAIADLTAGAWILRMPLPYNIDEDAYMGLLYTVGTATATSGTVDAWIDHGPQSSYDTQVSASNI
jgi:hypothetical protein